MNIEESEKVLSEAIEKHLAKGGVLIRGMTGTTYKDQDCRCALGCLRSGNTSFPTYVELAEHCLGWFWTQADAFVDGFDRDKPEPPDEAPHKEYFMLGRRLREKYKAKTLGEAIPIGVY